MAHSVRHPPTPPISVMAQVKEDSLLEVTEHLCDTDSEHGDWLPTLDVVKSGDTLAVRAPGGYGRCKKECSTMAYACRRHLEEVHNDLAEALYLQKPKSLDTLTSRVCKKWTKACRKEGRPLPDGHAWKDEEFKEMDDKGRETVAMMRKMKASGMPDMSMYTRDDMDELMDMDPEAMAEAMADEL